MRAPTHATFGLVFTIATGTVLGLALTPAVAAFVLLGSWLPDIDTPTSPIGRLCRPLAGWLERRVGHRTLTHSLLGLALATAPILPLAWLDPSWPLAFAFGYLSHLLVDAANPPGVPLFYPSPVRAVFPGRESLRPAEISRGEGILCTGLLLGLAVLWPLHQVGFTRSLHVLTRTTAGAIADFRGWEGTREVWADLDGHFRLSQRRLHRRVRILGIENVSTLIVLDPETDTVHTVGPNETANVYPSGIVAQPGPAVTVETRPVTLTQRLLRELLREVPPDGETYFHGLVRTSDAVTLKSDPEAYAALTPGVQALELRFARPRDLEAPELRGVFVLEGQVLVQTIRPPGVTRSTPPAPPTPAPEFDDVTELFIAHVTDPARELLVREGDRVRRGKMLARLSWREPDLERKRQQAQAELAERQSTLRLRETSLAQARALLATGLAASAALPRAEAEHLAARGAVAQARRALDQLVEEARRTSEVRSPVDGQVLTLRVHVIHGGEGTAVLRLLYRRPSPNGDGRVSKNVRTHSQALSETRTDERSGRGPVCPPDSRAMRSIQRAKQEGDHVSSMRHMESSGPAWRWSRSWSSGWSAPSGPWNSEAAWLASATATRLRCSTTGDRGSFVCMGSTPRRRARPSECERRSLRPASRSGRRSRCRSRGRIATGERSATSRSPTDAISIRSSCGPATHGGTGGTRWTSASRPLKRTRAVRAAGSGQTRTPSPRGTGAGVDRGPDGSMPAAEGSLARSTGITLRRAP
jgi:inner membrane protein